MKQAIIYEFETEIVPKKLFFNKKNTFVLAIKIVFLNLILHNEAYIPILHLIWK